MSIITPGWLAWRRTLWRKSTESMPTRVIARTYAAASMILLFIKCLHLNSFQKNTQWGPNFGSKAYHGIYVVAKGIKTLGHGATTIHSAAACFYSKYFYFGFQWPFWQICTTLGCRSPVHIFAHFFLNKCNSLYWNITKIALNPKCKFCHAPCQCFRQKLGWLGVNSGLETMAKLAFLN